MARSSSRCGTASRPSHPTTRTTKQAHRRSRLPGCGRRSPADAVLFATPEYNASIPGQLKNAIDWVSRPVATNPLRNVPVAVIGASPGMFGAVWAQAELKKVVALIGARVIDAELPVAQAPTRFDADGRLIDKEIRERLAEVMNQLVYRRVRAPGGPGDGLSAAASGSRQHVTTSATAPDCWTETAALLD